MDHDVLGGRYTLLEILGGGGMAHVYLARDAVLEREVAIKVLREQYAEDGDFVERFRREAKHAASLNHPSVVQVYDQGRAEDGTYYMAMEHVPGGTLKERFAKGQPLAPAEAAGIAAQVADALAVAHQRGIVHRDIKPQNVLLTNSGEAKVADFGIARAVSAKTITGTNYRLGTAAYMSPEQISGERVGPQSDLYSLGVVLYEMLTGTLPHEGADPIATAMKHLETPPPHPRDANLAVTEELDALTVKLLARAPEDRYSSATELAEDLRRIRDGLYPLAVEAGERPTTPISGVAGEENRTTPTRVAPGRGMPPAVDRPARRQISLLLVALLAGLAILGSLAWALLREPSQRSTRDAGGAARVGVPNVVSLSPDKAQNRLESENLRLGAREKAPSTRAAEGLVIEQNPAAGTEAGRGSAVEVRVGTGPARGPARESSPTASPTSSPLASPSASPASDEEPGKAAEEARKAEEEAAKEREKAREEALKRAEERRKLREEAREERQKAREEAREEAKE